jgi:hypothetical protein
MYRSTLTKQEGKLLEEELRLERYARFSDRIKCILLLDAGKSPESIAEYLFCNYSANSASITLAPSKGRLCGAKRGGDNNYSPKKGTPDQGVARKKTRQN